MVLRGRAGIKFIYNISVISRMNNNKRGQGSLEYLLLIGGGIVVAAVVVVLVLGMGTGSQEQTAEFYDLYTEEIGASVSAGGGGVQGSGGGETDIVGVGEAVVFSPNPSGGTAPYVCTVDFGDGGGEQVNTDCDGDTSFELSGGYAAEGNYIITSTITDSSEPPNDSTRTFEIEVAQTSIEFKILEDVGGSEIEIGPNSVPEVNVLEGDVVLSCEGSFLPGGGEYQCDFSAPVGTVAAIDNKNAYWTPPADEVGFYNIGASLKDAGGAEKASSVQEVEAYFLEDFSDPSSISLIDTVVNGSWTWVDSDKDSIRTGGLLKGESADSWVRAILNISAADPYSVKAELRAVQGQYGILMSSVGTGVGDMYSMWKDLKSSNKAYLRKSNPVLNNLLYDTKLTILRSSEKWCAFELQKINDLLTGSVDGQFICDTSTGGDGACERLDSELTGKKVGVGLYENGAPIELYFDNLEVRALKAS